MKRWMKLPKNSAHPNFTELHREDDWCAKAGCVPYCGPDPLTPEPPCVPAVEGKRKWPLKLDGCTWEEKARRTLTMFADVIKHSEYSFEDQEADDKICELTAVAELLAASTPLPVDLEEKKLSELAVCGVHTQYRAWCEHCHRNILNLQKTLALGRAEGIRAAMKEVAERFRREARVVDVIEVLRALKEKG